MVKLVGESAFYLSGVLLGSGLSAWIKGSLGGPSWIVFAIVLVPFAMFAHHLVPKPFKVRLVNFVGWFVAVELGLAAEILFSEVYSGSTSPLAIPSFFLGVLLFVTYVNWTRKTLEGSAKTDVLAMEKMEAIELSASWFRPERDILQLSKLGRIALGVLGGLTGYVASFLLLLYAGLFDLIISGYPVAAATFLTLVGLQRNRIIRRIASRGFTTVFNFRLAGFVSYVDAIASGLGGIWYGYGPRQTLPLVLPLASLFVLFLYFWIWWGKIFVTAEEGRLSIFQFLVENRRNGRGYFWLKHGLSTTENRLRSYGVAVKTGSLYFGSSYSLLEGSYIEWDLDALYLLGDWTSQPNDLKAIHNITSWFNFRCKQARKLAFKRAMSLLDRILEISPKSLYYIVSIIAGVVTLIISIVR